MHAWCVGLMITTFSPAYPAALTSARHVSIDSEGGVPPRNAAGKHRVAFRPARDVAIDRSHGADPIHSVTHNVPQGGIVEGRLERVEPHHQGKTWQRRIPYDAIAVLFELRNQIEQGVSKALTAVVGPGRRRMVASLDSVVEMKTTPYRPAASRGTRPLACRRS